MNYDEDMNEHDSLKNKNKIQNNYYDTMWEHNSSMFSQPETKRMDGGDDVNSVNNLLVSNNNSFSSSLSIVDYDLFNDLFEKDSKGKPFSKQGLSPL